MRTHVMSFPDTESYRSSYSLTETDKVEIYFLLGKGPSIHSIAKQIGCPRSHVICLLDSVSNDESPPCRSLPVPCSAPGPK